MNNKIAFTFLIITALAKADSHSSILKTSSAFIPLPAFSPSTPPSIAFFDADDVFVERKQWKNIPGFINIFWQAPWQTKGELLKVAWQMRSQPKEFWRSLKKLDGDVQIDEIAKKFPVLATTLPSGKTITEELKEVYSTGRPIQPTQEIMHELARNHVALGVATNQGTNTFTRLMRSRAVPSQETYQIIFTADNPDNTPQGTILYKKPDPEYFENLKDKARKEGYKGPLYFIDDKKENVQAAQKAGFVGIHYSSPEQLKEKLQEYNLLPQKAADVYRQKKAGIVHRVTSN